MRKGRGLVHAGRAVLAIAATTVFALMLASCPSPLGPVGRGDAESRRIAVRKPWFPHVITAPTVESNGALVLLAGGYAFPDALIPPSLGGVNPVDFRTVIPPILANRGFTVAYAEYNDSGYAVAKGYARTVALLDYMQASGNFESVYVIGGSLGSMVSLMLAEDAPVSVNLRGRPIRSRSRTNGITGALIFDGLVGGARKQVEYLGDVRSLFEAFFPGVIGYGVLEFPNVHRQLPNGDVIIDQDVVDQVAADGFFERITLWGLVNAIFPSRVKEMARVDPPVVPVRPDAWVRLGDTWVPEPLAGVLLPVGYSLLGVADLLDRAGLEATTDEDSDGIVETLFGNLSTRYRGSRADWLLNWVVPRFERSARSVYLDTNYEPSGDPGTTKIVTLHASRDTIVPIYHQAEYGARAAAAGKRENLGGIEVDVFGHGWFIDDAAAVGRLADVFLKELVYAGAPEDAKLTVSEYEGSYRPLAAEPIFGMPVY